MQDIEDIIQNKLNDHTFSFKNYDQEKIIPFIKDICTYEYASKKDVNIKIIELRKKYHVHPSKTQMCFIYDILVKEDVIKENKVFKNSIIGKGMRALSGVMVVSVLTSPYPSYIDESGKEVVQAFSCKHDCFYCPKEVDSNGKDLNPRSYLSDEPAVARALQNDYDAIRQFNDRAYQYVLNSHYVDKVELIVLGGTWTEYPKEYQEIFIRDLFYAANTFYDLEKRNKLSLLEEQVINETSKTRIIGLTLEMRPDSINEDEINRLRYLGCTRVQLGVQHLDKTILKKINRGCYKEDAVRALKLLKNYGYKVDAHWMPDLPGSTPSKDESMFKEIIYGDDLQFDQWKIYPTATVPWTRIKKWYDEGSYIPYTETDPTLLINLLFKIKQIVPTWVRLNRVIRDIPNKTRSGELYIYAGNKITNLRQVVHDKLKKENKFCPCIRCREVKNNYNLINCTQIIVKKYNSSAGIEYFISIESGNFPDSVYKTNKQKWYNTQTNTCEPGIIYGFLRLRLCDNESNKYFHEIKNTALVRELHVYGQVISNENQESSQHYGFGKQLMRKAEEISIMNCYYNISVISGIGVKNYYKKLGYNKENTYMVKRFNYTYIFDTYVSSFNDTIRWIIKEYPVYVMYIIYFIFLFHKK